MQLPPASRAVGEDAGTSGVSHLSILIIPFAPQAPVGPMAAEQALIVQAFGADDV